MTPLHKPCVVCGGIGGFRMPTNHYLDDNWADCSFCHGNGFTFALDETDPETLNYQNYRNRLEHILTGLGNIEISSSIIGKDLHIKATPFNRGAWVNLVKSLLKYAHYSERVSVTPRQVFSYTSQGKYEIHWELLFTLTSLHDLDGVIDILALYEKPID